MKKTFLFVMLGVLLTGCLVDSEMLQVSVLTQDGEHSFKVDVAESFTERQEGLQQIAELSDDQGMWFVFDKPQMLNFWMKDTLISLDIIFVDQDYKVVNIAHNVLPCSEECENYFSENLAQYVLEINGGLAEKLGILKGDTITPPK
jgi:uncharacterized protein